MNEQSRNFLNFLKLIPHEPTLITNEFQQQTVDFLATLNHNNVTQLQELQVYNLLKDMGIVDVKVIDRTEDTQAISINLTEYGKQITKQVS